MESIATLTQVLPASCPVSLCVLQEQSSEGPPPLSLSQEAKEATLDNPSANDELDTPTSIASVMTSTNDSSMETDTPQQTDTEVHNLYSCSAVC